MSADQSTPKRRRLARKAIRMAEMLELPALPTAWPDWMTPVKRAEMARNARRIAELLA